MHRRACGEERPTPFGHAAAGSAAPFEHIIDLARLALGVPVAGVWFKDSGDREAARGNGCDLGDGALDERLRSLTLEQESVLVLEDTLDADGGQQTRGAALRSYIGARLVMPDGNVAGLIFAGGTAPRAFDDAARTVLARLARCAVSEIALRLRDSRDDLTGLLTRNAFLGRLSQLHEEHARHGMPATLCFVDIDHFKSVNDRFGHAAGDMVLNRVSALCRATLGSEALIGRIGGEEFAIALPGTGLEEGTVILEALRESIAGLTFAIGQTLSVTASLGVCGLNAGIANTSVWCKMADAALYGAKHAGRNRVIVFRDTAGLAGRADGAGFFLQPHCRDDAERDDSGHEGRVRQLFAISA